MSSTAVLDLALIAMIMGAELAALVPITSLVAGFMIFLFQSITQIREITLALMPKTITVGITLYIRGY